MKSPLHLTTESGAPSFARFLRKGWDRAIFPPRVYRRATSLTLIAALCLWATAAFAQDFSGSSSAESKAAKGMVSYLFPEQVSIPAQNRLTSTAFPRRGRAAYQLPYATEKSLDPDESRNRRERVALKVTGVDFPDGALDYAFAFDPSEKLSVYTGDFTLKAHLTAPSGKLPATGASTVSGLIEVVLPAEDDSCCCGCHRKMNLVARGNFRALRANTPPQGWTVTRTRASGVSSIVRLPFRSRRSSGAPSAVSRFSSSTCFSVGSSGLPIAA